MIITIANQKGGVSKTHTAAAIACALRESGKKVLAIDADPQGSLSFLLGADTTAPGLLEAIQGEATPAEAIQHTTQADIMAASKLLAAETAPADLREILRRLRYDFIVIDTGPGLSGLMLAAMKAADLVIIPAKANAGSLQGIKDTADSLAEIRQRKAGCAVLFTQIHTRPTTAEKAFLEAIQNTCEARSLPVLETVIRYAEAPITSGESFRESIITYDKNSKPAQDYFRALHEMKLL